MFKPLEGKLVIDCTLAGAGPSCTKLLTEYGADTIWIECPKGTSTRLVHKFDFYTTGKRSLAIDLKSEEGYKVICDLIRKADVFVSNYRPKALEHLKLTYDDVKAIRPDIIYATITGFGEAGADRNCPGYDPVAYWARGGMMRDIAEKGSLVVPPIAMGDISTGMATCMGILAALLNREKTGEGCHVMGSILGTAAYINHDAEIEVQYGEKYPKTRKAPRRALLNSYRAADGEWFTITIINNFDKNFPALLHAIGRDDLIGDPRWPDINSTMYEGAPELVAILDETFAQMTLKDALHRLRAADIPVSAVRSTEDFVCRDKQAKENGYFYPLKASLPPSKGANAAVSENGEAIAESNENAAEGGSIANVAGRKDAAGGEDAGEKDAPERPESLAGCDDDVILVPASPVKFDSPMSGINPIDAKGPAFGEHTIEILKECGYSDEDVKDMQEKGIIR